MKSFHFALVAEEKHNFPPEMFNWLEKTVEGFRLRKSEWKVHVWNDKCSWPEFAQMIFGTNEARANETQLNLQIGRWFFILKFAVTYHLTSIFTRDFCDESSNSTYAYGKSSLLRSPACVSSLKISFRGMASAIRFRTGVSPWCSALNGARKFFTLRGDRQSIS